MTLEFASAERIRVVNGRPVVTLFVEQPVDMDELRAYVRNLKETRFPREDVAFWVHAVEPGRSDGPRLIITTMANILPVDPYGDDSPHPPAARPEPAPAQNRSGSDLFDLSAFVAPKPE